MERRAERQINSHREKWPWGGVGGLIFFFYDGRYCHLYFGENELVEKERWDESHRR